jgi:hypothetical protein
LWFLVLKTENRNLWILALRARMTKKEGGRKRGRKNRPL